MDRRKIDEFLKKYKESPVRVSPYMIKNMDEVVVRNNDKPPLISEDLREGMENEYGTHPEAYIKARCEDWIDDTAKIFTGIKAYRKLLQKYYTPTEAAVYDLGELSAKNEDGDITCVDKSAAYHLLVAAEECCELITEIFTCLMMGVSGKPYPINGIKEELADVLAAVDYSRIVLGISEDELNYLRMIKNARQFARQHITEGDYSNLIDFLPNQPYGTDKITTSPIDHYPELPQYVKDLIEEFSKE